MVDWGNVDSVVVLSFLCQLFNDGLCLWHVTGSTNLWKKILYIYRSITLSTIQGFIYWIRVILHRFYFHINSLHLNPQVTGKVVSINHKESWYAYCTIRYRYMVNLTMCQFGLNGVALDPFTQATKTNGERDERVNVIRMGYLYTCWCNLLKKSHVQINKLQNGDKQCRIDVFKTAVWKSNDKVTASP